MAGVKKSITVGEVWRQELEVAGHVVSTVRKQTEVVAGALLTFFQFGFRAQTTGWCRPPISGKLT